MGKILATDYNDIATVTKAVVGTAPVTTPSPTWPKPAAITGTAYGSDDPTYGYGQDTSNLPTVSNDPANVAGDEVIIKKDDWNNLRSHLYKAYRLQNAANPTDTLLPPVVNSTLPVKVYQNTKDKFATMATNLKTTRYPSTWRLNVSEASADVISSATLSANTWGDSGNSTKTITFYIDFGTSDALRYFFNSGSELWIYTSATGGSSTVAGSKDYDWTQMLPGPATTSSGTGTGEAPGEAVRLYWDQVTVTNNNYPQAGSQTLAGTYGTYNLPVAPTAARQIFKKVSEGVYVNNNFTITVRYSNIGKSELEVKCTFVDGSALTVNWPSIGQAAWGIDEKIGATITTTVVAFRPYGTGKINIPAPTVVTPTIGTS